MKIMICSFSLLMLIGLYANAQSGVDTKSKQNVAKVQQPVQPNPDAGERAFSANCSRCHNAPDQISPRITGTVVRHMRVRANLSAADERALLRFFNP